MGAPPTTPRGPTATATESPLANAPRPTRAPSTLRVVLDVTRPPTPLPRLVSQFNLDVDEHEAHVSALQPWRRARDPPPLVLEISLRPSSETDAAPRPAALVERWTFRRVIPGDASPTSHASPGTSPGHPGTTRPVPRDGTDAPAA